LAFPDSVGVIFHNGTDARSFSPAWNSPILRAASPVCPDERMGLADFHPCPAHPLPPPIPAN